MTEDKYKWKPKRRSVAMKALEIRELTVMLRLHAHQLTGGVAIGRHYCKVSESDAWFLMRKISEALDNITHEQMVDEHLGLNGRIVPLKDIEKAAIKHALSIRTNCSQNEIAKELGITARTLRTKRDLYNLPGANN